MLLGGRPSPIGLDIGRHSVKAVQCASGGHGPRIVARLTLSRTGEGSVPREDEARRLGEVLWRHGFQGKRAVVGVPESCLLTAVVEVPPASAKAPLEVIAAAELARLHGAEPEALQTDCWRLAAVGPKAQRHEAVAVGVKSADMLELLGSLESRDGAGLSVVAADVGTCARARAAMLAPPAEAQWAVLDLGWTAARLAVVQNGAVVYERALPDSGMAHLELRMSQECGLTPEDMRHVLGRGGGGGSRRISGAWVGALVGYAAGVSGEVKDSLRYLALHRSMSLPRTILLTGGGAESGPVVEKLGEALGAGEPMAIGRYLGGPGAEGACSGLAMALGLSLWAA